MTMLTSQQQLLNILNIPQLQLQPRFNRADASNPADLSPTENTSHCCLTQDITAAIGSLNWQLSADITECQIQQLTLYTPLLATLRSPQLKKQLWRLLAGYDNSEIHTDVNDD